MNTIQTLGDLKKALSVYPDKLPVKFRSSDRKFWLNNDTQIALVQEPLAGGSAMYTEISLIPEPVISRKPVFVGFESPTNSSGETMNYELLRPFDLEAAKTGAKLIGIWNCIEFDYLAGPNAKGEIVFNESDFGFAIIRKSGINDIRMAPLCWVEGRPVYMDDVLYVKTPPGRTGSVVTAEFAETGDGHCRFRTDNGAVQLILLSELTWTPPKVKKEGWINVYPADRRVNDVALTGVNVRPSEDAANRIAQRGRIACVRIEWEE